MTFQMFIISDFRQNSLPWLAWDHRSHLNQRKSPNHHLYKIDLGLDQRSEAEFCPFLSILGLVVCLCMKQMWLVPRTFNTTTLQAFIFKCFRQHSYLRNSSYSPQYVPLCVKVGTISVHTLANIALRLRVFSLHFFLSVCMAICVIAIHHVNHAR